MMKKVYYQIEYHYVGSETSFLDAYDFHTFEAAQTRIEEIKESLADYVEQTGRPIEKFRIVKTTKEYFDVEVEGT